MRITIVGSGNVATHISAALKNAGHRIVQVYSRNLHNAALLAYHVGAEATDDLNALTINTDLFIISVKDDAVVPTIAQLAKYGKLIAHTSGAVELLPMLQFTQQAGVFYPLQTFSKTKELNFREVPMCIEGVSEAITKTLEDLARDISNKVYRISSQQRKVLHLAAVFACNFTNHLYGVGEGLLKDSGMSFDMLRPLIAETADKIKERSPFKVQTGPAVRNDETTMAAHLQLLEQQPHLQDVYKMLSQDIIKNHNEVNGDR
ncbi:DUF2520 domain-containing protein [Mucilaginibacter achroorhodeus]|uniref:DUF2520 domain-containing protein n=1 Tax=Mucilaginibacter achroorhodeus TaxID=2599294 RepID=A0A563U100_9SPHI|nr:Rossmann-like and DUF2520 domain-containing protein [Mucilaginibacter achroorhodeus]TWR25294.1 DUF2520 domain-containing protein [Mucilaginibacter achroorhodeus]